MDGRVSHSIYHGSCDGAAVRRERPKLIKKVMDIVSSSAFILSIIGFIIGRVSILNMLSPFGAAFLASCVLTVGIKSGAIIGICIVAGLMTGTLGPLAIQSIASIMLVFLMARFLRFNKRTPALKAGFAAFLSNFAVALSANIFLNGSLILYDTLMGLFNSTIVMALVYIYNYSLPVIVERKRRVLLSNEELVCLAILVSIIISGLSDVFIYGVSLKAALSVFAIISVAYGQGAGVGAAIGTTIGLITCISSNQVPVAIGTYAFCGLLAGIFKDMGKFGAALGFIVGDVVIHFYLGGRSPVIGFDELAGGILLFAVIPSSLIDKVLPFLGSNARSIAQQQSYVDKIKDLIRVKIIHIIDVFNELSRTLEENDGSEKLRQNSEINSIINSIVDKTCSDCDARNICWDRDFYRTYQNMFDVIDVIQTDGKMDMDTVPSDLKDKCLKLNQLIKTSNYMFDIYRMNYKWRRKAQEGKKVISQQLHGTVEVLKKLSEEIGQEIDFKGDVEEEIAVALDKEGIEFSDVAVTRDEMGRYEVNLYKRACLGRRECIKDISPVVSRVINRKMKRDSTSCMMKEGTNLCYFRLVEAVKYQISTGIAREVKDEGGVSGDNYSFIELKDGKYMMALSDGMGTGPAAAMESNAAITLLEKYLEAGFDKSIALKAINMTMALKSSDDNFATIDLAVADLYTGRVELIKIGGASTFIKRADGSVEALNFATLPMGILSSVEIESKDVKLAHGDFIIMVTDGVEEAGNGADGKWLTRALEDIDSRNPQQLADDLLKKAVERSGGKVADDMTVLASKIWEVM